MNNIVRIASVLSITALFGCSGTDNSSPVEASGGANPGVGGGMASTGGTPSVTGGSGNTIGGTSGAATGVLPSATGGSSASTTGTSPTGWLRTEGNKILLPN